MNQKNRLCIIFSCAALLACGLTCQFLQAAEQPKTTTNSNDQANQATSTDIKAISEAFGHFIGRNLKTSGINFDLESLIKGMRDGAAGKPAPMSDQEYEEKMAALQERAFKNLSEENLKAATDFLIQNGKKAGIVEVEPGKLQYIIVKEGNGPAITEHSSPLINYTGTYIDGTVFGSSKDTGGPITIPVDQTIPGFSKGLLGMKEGETRKIFVHPDLGYGVTGHLPPNSLLIFDVEVLKANNADAKDNDNQQTSDAYASPKSQPHYNFAQDEDENELDEEYDEEGHLY